MYYKKSSPSLRASLTLSLVNLAASLLRAAISRGNSWTTTITITTTTTTTISCTITITTISCIMATKSNLGKGVRKHFMLTSLATNLSEQSSEAGHLSQIKVIITFS